MVSILRNKRDATRFQVLIEVASYGPTIHQRSVAGRLDITPQAVSEYLEQLTRDGLVNCTGRSKYQITDSGVNWLIKNSREMRAYFDRVDAIINNIALSPAIADNTIKCGQRIGLVMRGGILYAVAETGEKCTATASADAGAGEDVGVCDVQGLIEFRHGKVTILVIPGIAGGGSKNADLKTLKKHISAASYIGAIGLEPFAALQKIGLAPDRFCFYGVSAFAADACLHGLFPTIVCAETDWYQLIADLREKNTEYESINLSTGSTTKLE